MILLYLVFFVFFIICFAYNQSKGGSDSSRIESCPKAISLCLSILNSWVFIGRMDLGDRINLMCKISGKNSSWQVILNFYLTMSREL